MTGKLAIIATLAIALAAPAAADAQSTKMLTHRVKRGDSLDLLAAEYYGSRRHAIFIMKANGLTHSRALRPGERLKIPISVAITTRVGDTFGGLAEEHLGDARRASFLADFNNLDADASIAAGQTLSIPFHVVHNAERRVTLRQLALAYFGAAKYQDLLRDYNFLGGSTLDKGEKLIVPIVHVRVPANRLPKPDEESAALAAKRAEQIEKARTAVPAAGAAWSNGDFARVKRLLADIETDYLDAPSAVAVSILLGSTYVAFADNDSARASFKKAIDRKADYQLPTYHYSPKIIEVWKQAGGEIREGK
jgi:LysM repeat protein